MIQEFKVELIAKGSSLYRVHVKKSPKAPDVLITDVGFGVSQSLPVVALCYYVPEGSTILLEQPEIHLHPSVQAGLADVLIDAVKTRGVQIVLESHSEHLLLRLQRRIAEQQGLSEKNVALYFCDSRAGESRIRRLQMDMYGDIVNWPDEFFGDAFGEVAAKAKAALDRKRAIQK